MCEVGAGKSLLAKFAQRSAIPMTHLLILDSDPEMLSYSEPFRSFGAHLVVADARQLPFPANSLHLIVSVVGDAYNTRAFWIEAERVLRPGGEIAFTSPSATWASRYRSAVGDPIDVAAFVVSDGSRLSVPSFCRPVEDQLVLIEEAGLRVKQTAQIMVSDLDVSRVSSKLTSSLEPTESVLEGFIASKP